MPSSSRSRMGICVNNKTKVKWDKRKSCFHSVISEAQKCRAHNTHLDFHVLQARAVLVLSLQLPCRQEECADCQLCPQDCPQGCPVSLCPSGCSSCQQQLLCVARCHFVLSHSVPTPWTDSWAASLTAPTPWKYCWFGSQHHRYSQNIHRILERTYEDQVQLWSEWLMQGLNPQGWC